MSIFATLNKIKNKMEAKFIILDDVVMVNITEIEHTCAWMHMGNEVIGTIINFKSGREVTTSESLEIVRDKIMQAINESGHSPFPT